ncbi:tetratricopeptide repeat protein [Thermodesulfobacteriota bacterium]
MSSSTDKHQIFSKKKTVLVRPDVLVCILLAVLTLAVYGQVGDFSWTNLEDPLNITENPYVQGPVTIEKIVWAFTDGTWVTNYWAPLLWLSFLADYQIYGLNPGGYHLTNVILHIANALLLFIIFKRATGALWRSAFVAALFAIHPLHVESVAWITERKDVLSSLFWMLTMASYVWYAERLGVLRYLMTCFFFILGLMAKPMLVTLPFVLLLLDYWPLGRLHIGQTGGGFHSTGHASSILSLIWEKIPFFVIMLVLSVATFVTQNREGVVAPLSSIPMMVRFENVLVSYALYIQKMFWPHPLAVLYPHPGSLPLWQTVPAFLFLFGISILAISAIRKHPWFTFGWAWYLGTLVPVIGWVVIGPHAMADRYTYIPLIGLFIVISWGSWELTEKWRFQKIILATAMPIILVILLSVTWMQLRNWVNSAVLFDHTLKVTSGNYVIHNNMGVTLAEMGKTADAIGHYTEALRINPGYAEASNNLGEALLVQGDIERAADHFLMALRVDPDLKEAHYNMGITMSVRGNLDKAVQHYLAALKIDPEYVQAHNNIGVVFIRQGMRQEAINHFREALRINPAYSGARHNLQRISAGQIRND